MTSHFTFHLQTLRTIERKKKAQQNDSLTFYTPAINILEKDRKKERSALHKHFTANAKEIEVSGKAW